MAFKIERGQWEMQWYPKVASTSITSGMLMCLVAGYATPQGTTSGATATPVLGIYEGPAILSSDATNTYIAIQVNTDNNGLMRADVTGTLAATSPGSDFDITADSLHVAQASNTYKAVTCIGYVSASQGLFTINKNVNVNA